MKITATLLSIPPYISTQWKNISTLHVREENDAYTLTVILQNNAEIEVPNLDKETIDEIFEAHAKVSTEPRFPSLPNLLDAPISFSLPLKSDGPFEGFGTPTQHNPEQANLPPIPPEVLKKISTIAKAFGIDEIPSLPKAEPHCNCVYCQIARSISEETTPIEEIEEVAEHELTFRDWEIKDNGDHLYTVTNPLDSNEQYSVFLGTPIGCTCGSKNCEHIRSVLSS